MNGRRSQGSAAGGTGGEGGELEEELEEYMGSNDSAGSGATMSNHEEGLDPIEGRDDEPLTASQENVDKASKWKGGSTSDTATTESYSMDSTEAGSSKTEQSPKEKASKAVKHEISMKRTHQVQDDPAAAQTRPLETREELLKRLDKAIKKAAEHGLDVKLGFANAEDFSEEDNFKLGAKLREKEVKLTEMRSQVQSLHSELTRREAEYTKLLDPKKKEAEGRLARCRVKVEAEEQKNTQLSEKLANTKESLEVFRGEASRAREGLLERLVQNEEERDRYRHICVAELVRLLLQERDAAHYISSGRASRETRTAGTSSSSSSSLGSAARGTGQMLRELEQLREKNQRLRLTLAALEEQVAEAGKGGQQVRQLKQRVVALLHKQMREKGLRFQIVRETEAMDKKVMVLSDHVERLMLHLKHEIMDKAQAHSVQGRALREIDLIRTRNDTLAKKNLRKDRVIVELQEGERILEDQLRLLDDKYAELRAKLHSTRQTYRKEVKRVMDEAQALRLRWEKETRGAMPLELVPLPYTYPPRGGRVSQSAPLRQRPSPSGRAVVSEGGSKAERLHFDGSELQVPPVPSIPPPDIDVSLLDLHLPPGSAAEPHEPWSDVKVAGLTQALDERRRSTAATASA